MKKLYKSPEFYKIIFEAEELITISILEFDSDGIEDYGDTGA